MQEYDYVEAGLRGRIFELEQELAAPRVQAAQLQLAHAEQAALLERLGVVMDALEKVRVAVEVETGRNWDTTKLYIESTIAAVL
jgi:hypothetical protein